MLGYFSSAWNVRTTMLHENVLTQLASYEVNSDIKSCNKDVIVCDSRGLIIMVGFSALNPSPTKQISPLIELKLEHQFCNTEHLDSLQKKKNLVLSCGGGVGGC